MTTHCRLVVLLIAIASCRAQAVDATVPPRRASAPVSDPVASAPPRAESSASAAPRESNAPIPTEPLSPADVVIDRAPTAAGAPAALYAELFLAGATWEVTRRDTVATGMTTPPSTRKTSARARCTVATVDRRAWAITSHITCGDNAETAVVAPFSGYWAATAVGLFHFAEDPGPKAPPLTRSVAVLAAEPSPGKLEQSDPGNRFGPVWSADVVRSGDSWCSGQLSTSTSVRRCIAPKRGFVSGSASASTGMTVYTVELDVTRFTPGRPLTP